MSRHEPITRPGSLCRSLPGLLRGLRSVLTLVAVTLSSLWSAVALCSDETMSREYQLKAAFVYNFTKFIEWPARSFSDANAPIVIGVVGETPLATELERLVLNRRVNGHAFLVRKIDSPADATATHLIFVSETEDSRFSSWRPALDSRPIVTIGESPAFAQNGGTIRFVLENDKVRFEISTLKAEQSGLRISAQLQKLATKVHRTAP